MLLTCLLIAGFCGFTQTFTMGKQCRELVNAATALLQEKKFQQALEGYTQMEQSCKTRDARELVYTGKAEALNGLGRYEEAIAASDAALKLSKNKSLGGYFQKAYAQNKMGDVAASKASLANVMDLTEKNLDTRTKARNYALMSLVHQRQLNEPDSAAFYLDKAIALDAANPDFYIQKGDLLMAGQHYEAAFAQYDKAVEMGRTDMDMYVIRSNARMKMVQAKYGTNNTQELRSKMTATEKEQVCRELTKALSLGLKDMRKDMFAAMVCK
ncbi:Tetratricopeptide repeat-containing protein [Cnuella takakiae]|uniref:Tetratricopeptide repeat-containing protein n=2 Tax=Cnuella takakiae TaxID=1302690 RepID=A0A1M5B0A5_9BACT|nr:hypothetical protein BUE76_16390 [Cnuella takakiae]SHF35883.1 Tetratricopeptide repeat-containing protein [Cnuella takakiae]